MSTVPLETVKRAVRTTALGSEIITHRIDAGATRWATTGPRDNAPRQDTGRDSTTGHDKDTRQDKGKDKGDRFKIPQNARTAIITVAPLLVLAIAFRPTSLGALIACLGLYVLVIITWGYSPTAALIATYAAVATMWPTLMTIAALIWLPTAYRTGTRDPLNVADDEPSEGEHETPAEDSLIALVRHLIGDRYGVHLRDIVDALNQTSTGREFNAPEVRAALDLRGVPTRAKVRGPRGGISGAPETATRGVHRDDLPAAPKPPGTPSESPSQAPPPEKADEPVATNATSL